MTIALILKEKTLIFALIALLSISVFALIVADITDLKIWLQTQRAYTDVSNAITHDRGLNRT